MQLSPRIACAVLLGACCAQGTATPAEVGFEEQTLVPDISSAGVVLSSSGVHVAAVIPKGSRQAVVVDGAEGPRFDQIAVTGIYRFDGMGGRIEPGQQMGPNTTGRPVMGLGSGGGNQQVIFNRDGSHYAYVGRSGSDVALVLDGREVLRGPYQQISWLAFTPDGNRLIAAAMNTNGQNCVVADGKAGPWGADVGNVFVTPDGAHYAYTGRAIEGQQTPWMVVDGRQVKYLGEIVGFAASGALFTRTTANYNQILLVNGKPMAQGSSFEFLTLNGNRLVLAVTPTPGNPPQQKPSVLTVDGQIVPGTEGAIVNQAYFSPDGKRWAVLCQRNQPVMEAFMIVDGKRELSYQTIYPTAPYAPSFSPDSSKFLYVATAQNGGMFVVVNGEESDAVSNIGTGPVWSPVGSRLAWGGVTSRQKQVFYLDGKLTPLVKNAQPGPAFSFSADGAHCWWSFGPPYGLSMILDGKEIPDIGGMTLTGAEAVDGPYATVRISPDGRHTAYLGIDAKDNSRRGLWLDRTLVAASPNNPQVSRVTFTPDSQHVFWATSTVRNNVGGVSVFADGREVLWYERSTLDNTPGAWEMGADGTLTLVGVVDGSLKRYRIPAPANSNIASMLASAGGKAVEETSALVPVATAAPAPGGPSASMPATGASFAPVAPEAPKPSMPAGPKPEGLAAAAALTWNELVARPNLWRNSAPSWRSFAFRAE